MHTTHVINSDIAHAKASSWPGTHPRQCRAGRHLLVRTEQYLPSQTILLKIPPAIKRHVPGCRLRKTSPFPVCDSVTVWTRPLSYSWVTDPKISEACGEEKTNMRTTVIGACDIPADPFGHCMHTESNTRTRIACVRIPRECTQSEHARTTRTQIGRAHV